MQRPPGWFGDGSGKVYRRACENARLLVEVGVHLGRSLSYLNDLPDLKVIAVDNWGGADGDDRLRQFQRHMAHLEMIDRIQVMRCDSIEASTRVMDGTADVVFIDAEHSMKAVSADLEAWWPKVRPGGVMMGHDYNEPVHPGVVAAVNTFAITNSLKYDVQDVCWLIRKESHAV